MNAQSPHVRAILHRLGHACGKSAYVHQLQRTVLDDIERRRRYIEHLPALGHACVGQQQRVMASVALPWQWVIHGLGRLLDTLERRPFVPYLATGRLARRLAQRARLLLFSTVLLQPQVLNSHKFHSIVFAKKYTIFSA